MALSVDLFMPLKVTSYGSVLFGKSLLKVVASVGTCRVFPCRVHYEALNVSNLVYRVYRVPLLPGATQEAPVLNGGIWLLFRELAGKLFPTGWKNDQMLVVVVELPCAN